MTPTNGHKLGPRTAAAASRRRRAPLTAAFCLFCAMIAWSAPSVAQPPDTLWARTYGGTNIDVGHWVQPTADGGFIITGYTRSFGTTSGRNVWLLKTDAAGSLQWHNTFGGNDDDEGYAVQQTSNGGYIIAGYTKSFGAGGKDVLLVKTDAVGESVWIKTFGGIHDDEGYAVQETAAGDYVVAGATSSFGAGGRDAYLILTDADGNEVWTRTHGGLSSDGAWSVQQTADGGFVLAGWTFSLGGGYLGNAWLVKTDGQGIQQWQRAFGGSGVDRAHCARQTGDGGYILTGYTDSYGAGLYDLLLIRTDAEGYSRWQQTFGGSGRDYGQSVRQTSDDGFVVVGYTLSYGAGSEDVWVIKTDGDGEEKWSRTYGGSNADVGYCIEQTADGGFIVAGYTLSFGAGVHDAWLIRIAGEATGVEQIPAALAISAVAPNPFNPRTTVWLEIPRAGGVTLAVHDLRGRLVRTLWHGPLAAGRHPVSWDGLDDRGAPAPSGVYLVRLVTADGAQRTVKATLSK